MENKLQEFQKLKKQAEQKIIIGGAIAIVGILLLVAFASYGPYGLIIVIPGIIVIGLASSNFSKLSVRFKNEVLKDMIVEFVDDGEFYPQRGLSINVVYSTEFLKRADRYKTEDYLSGKIDGVSFVSSDVKLEERHVQRTKNGTRTYYETYFLGRVFVFDFNKSFDGYLQVLESGRPTKNRGYNKVKLESIEFNKKFKTYSTSDHSAFYVLTPHFMQSLQTFEKNNKGTISFSFIDNNLYIGLNNYRDTFELKMFRELNQSSLKEFQNEMLVLKEVVMELKLNNNIFKKE